MTDVPNARSQRAPADGIWGPALKEAGVAFMTAALLLTIFYVPAFCWIHPEFVPYMDRETNKVIAAGKDLIPVSVGGYRVKGTSAIIEDFNGDEAILALPRSFQAEDYPFIKVNLSGFTRYSKFKILWRRADDLLQTHALEFNRSGDEVTQIAMVAGDKDYRGLISDIALLVHEGPSHTGFNNNNQQIIIESIEFRPFSAHRVIEQIYSDWAYPPLLQAYSNNVVVGTHPNPLLSLATVINLIIIAALLLLLATRLVARENKRRQTAPVFAVTLCLVMYGSSIHELSRWGARAEQLIDNQQRYVGKALEKRIQAADMRCGRFKEDCKRDFLPYF